MVVHMRLMAMLFLFVDVRDVRMLNRRVVVIVGVGGQEMHPVLTLMKVVRHVIMLVTMLDGLVQVTTMSPSHRDHLLPGRFSGLLTSDDRTSPSEGAHDPQFRTRLDLVCGESAAIRIESDLALSRSPA